MFGTIIKGLIPEPRQPDQPRHYIGRHRSAQALQDASDEPGAVSPTDAETDRAPARPTESRTPDSASESWAPGQDADVEAYRRAG